MVGDERVSWAGAMTNPCRSDRFPRSASRSPLPALPSRPWSCPPQDAQVVHDHAESDPALHPARAAIATAPEPVAALEDADAAFAPGAPAQRLAEPAVARRRGLRVGRRAPGLAGQHDLSTPSSVAKRSLSREANPPSATASRGGRPNNS